MISLCVYVCLYIYIYRKTRKSDSSKLESVNPGHDIHSIEDGLDNVQDTAGIGLIFTRSWLG